MSGACASLEPVLMLSMIVVFIMLAIFLGIACWQIVKESLFK